MYGGGVHRDSRVTMCHQYRSLLIGQVVCFQYLEITPVMSLISVAKGVLPLPTSVVGNNECGSKSVESDATEDAAVPVPSTVLISAPAPCDLIGRGDAGGGTTSDVKIN